MIASDTDSYDEKSQDNDSLNNSLSLNQEEEDEDFNEEELLQNQLGSVEIGKLLKAKERLKKQEIQKEYQNDRQKLNRTKAYLKNKFDEKNKSKSKDQPKEASALVKPNKLKQFYTNYKSNASGRVNIDPRFDTFNKDSISKPSKYPVESKDKRYEFLQEKAEEYLKSLSNIKKNVKIDDEEHELIKNQRSVVKNYLSKEKQNKLKREIYDKVSTEIGDDSNSNLKLKKQKYKEKLQEEKEKQIAEGKNNKFNKKKKYRNQ